MTVDSSPAPVDTPITRLFGIRYPVVQGGMVWVSGWKLAAAVSDAGGLGLIGGGSMDPELLRTHIRRAKAACNKPFGVNIPLFYKHAAAMLEVVKEEGVGIVFTSAGSPKAAVPGLKAAGILSVHVAATPDQAKKCADLGCDAVVVEGFEAGGHDGRDELTGFVLIPQAADLCPVPVIAAGGMVSGRSLAAAMALGAAGIQVGSRFAASVESSAHEVYKQTIVAAGATDTRFTFRQLAPVRMYANDFAVRAAAAEARGAPAGELAELLGRGRSKKGIFEGDLVEGELHVGQGIGMIRAVEPAARIVHDIVREFQNVAARLGAYGGVMVSGGGG